MCYILISTIHFILSITTFQIFVKFCAEFHRTLFVSGKKFAVNLVYRKRSYSKLRRLVTVKRYRPWRIVVCVSGLNKWASWRQRKNSSLYLRKMVYEELKVNEYFIFRLHLNNQILINYQWTINRLNKKELFNLTIDICDLFE